LVIGETLINDSFHIQTHVFPLLRRCTGGDFLVKVKKRAGHMQDFDRAKLKASLKKAGAKEEHVTKVTEIVAGKVKEGMAASEIKRMAATELRRMDATAAQKYETFKTPKK